MMTAPSSSLSFDATSVREAARHRWREILPSLCIEVPSSPKRHGPCPTCGGKDRFRFDDQDGKGTWFCNQCEPKAGDGFALVQNVRRSDFPEALRLVADALRLSPQSNGHQAKSILETYDYTDQAGTLLFQVVRFVPKDFRQRQPDGQGGWIWNLKDLEPVLYKLPQVLAASSVVIVEGEKDVETAYRLGLPDGWAATCNPMGAGKWRPSYSEALAGTRVVILPDADAPGEKHAEEVARSLKNKAHTIQRLTLPEGLKDLSAWAASQTPAEFYQLLQQAVPWEAVEQFVSMSTPRTGPPHESNFQAMSVSDFLDVPPDEDLANWILDDYLPAGGLVLIAGKPKEGKTTLCYELAVKVSKGQPFLGRETKAGGVLILGLEEHPRDMRLRLRHLGADGANLFVYSGASLHPTADTIEHLKRYVTDHAIHLVLIDTLSAFWTVSDENDAAAVQKAIQPILRLARESGACVLLIHHARKSEGSHGDEIRGSGALFAAVDVALILKRHEVETQRKLTANSRYPDTPTELVIELRDSGYAALGDPAKVNRQAKREKMKAALTGEPLDVKTLAQQAGVPQRDAHRLLGELHTAQEAQRSGTGRKNDPYRYSGNSFHATPPVLGGSPHESNCEQSEFVSCAPQSPCTKQNPALLSEEEVNLAD